MMPAPASSDATVTPDPRRRCVETASLPTRPLLDSDAFAPSQAAHRVNATDSVALVEFPWVQRSTSELEHENLA